VFWGYVPALDKEPWFTVTLAVEMGSPVDEDLALIPPSSTTLSQRSESTKRV